MGYIASNGWMIICAVLESVW